MTFYIGVWSSLHLFIVIRLRQLVQLWLWPILLLLIFSVDSNDNDQIYFSKDRFRVLMSELYMLTQDFELANFSFSYMLGTSDTWLQSMLQAGNSQRNQMFSPLGSCFWNWLLVVDLSTQPILSWKTVWWIGWVIFFFALLFSNHGSPVMAMKSWISQGTN